MVHFAHLSFGFTSLFPGWKTTELVAHCFRVVDVDDLGLFIDHFDALAFVVLLVELLNDLGFLFLTFFLCTNNKKGVCDYCCCCDCEHEIQWMWQKFLPFGSGRLF